MAETQDLELVVAGGQIAYAHGDSKERALATFHEFTGHRLTVLSIEQYDTPNDWIIRYVRTVPE